MIKRIRHNIIETSYEVSSEAKNASLFGIGNGYFGIRGSFEEFGDVYIQGTYVRGVFDQIIEIPHAISDNTYMKRFYFDEQKLKDFEYEDSCINIADFTSLKILVDGKPLLPWTYKIAYWRRYFDYRNGSLVREVVYEDEEGHQTRCRFEKLACFHEPHYFIQKVSVERLNHSLSLSVLSGVDAKVKTNGQKKSQVTHSEVIGGRTLLDFAFGKKYRQTGRLLMVNEASGGTEVSHQFTNGVYSDVFTAIGKAIEVRKVVYFEASVDAGYGFKNLSSCPLPHYQDLYSASQKRFRKDFALVDVRIGNPELDAYTRFANFQSYIGGSRFDAIHSLSAKNLTSEVYNQFVWWDCEIYQFPFFLTSLPDVARNGLLYRLHRLNEAEKIAKSEGYEGAKYPFCSSVRGDENVWIYARHPFLQIHINGDVAFALIRYYDATLDSSVLLREGGFKALFEILDYFVSRCVKKDDGYELLGVTGTDEHHPYVNNDAYTNYELHYLLERALALSKELGYPLDPAEEKRFLDLRDHLKLPLPEKGVIPQFDGYFKLSKKLPLEGRGEPGFQMKQSGLYHLSQRIKQPDVLLLPTYLNIPLPGSYRKTWHLYQERCEASSSLTYPAHALAAVDNGERKAFEENYLLSLQMDFRDLYHTAYQGLHAGALAGGRYMISRGLLGIVPEKDYLAVSPIYDPLFGSIRFSYAYHGARLQVQWGESGVALTSDKTLTIKKGSRFLMLKKGQTLRLSSQKFRKEEKV